MTELFELGTCLMDFLTMRDIVQSSLTSCVSTNRGLSKWSTTCALSRLSRSEQRP